MCARNCGKEHRFWPDIRWYCVPRRLNAQPYRRVLDQKHDGNLWRETCPTSWLPMPRSSSPTISKTARRQDVIILRRKVEGEIGGLVRSSFKVPTGSEILCLSGKTGSDQRIARTTGLAPEQNTPSATYLAARLRRKRRNSCAHTSARQEDALKLNSCRSRLQSAARFCSVR